MAIDQVCINTLYKWGNCVIDFRIDGINGVFRVADSDSDGIDLGKYLDHIEKNLNFFKQFAAFDWAQTETGHNWGNGWEWQETTHSVLHKHYRLSLATAWFSAPFGGNAKPDPVKQMHWLHPQIKSDGIMLLWSWNHNRQPSRVAYFFPDKE